MNCQRDKFSLDDEHTYLNGAYMSPLLRSVEEAGINGLKLKSNPYKINRSHFFDDLITLKKQFKQLLNLSSIQNMTIIPAVSYGMSNAAQAIPIKESTKSEILIVGDQFPSNYYVWEVYAKEHNLNLKIINCPESPDRGSDWNQKILESINDDTLLLAIAHVHWADGTIFHLSDMSKKLKSYGGMLMVDGTQSFGAYPFDNNVIEADVIVASAYKWLLGPYGIGFAYYGDELCHGSPIENSWLNRKNSEDFAGLVNYQTEYKTGAERYQMGGAPNFITVPMAISAVQQLIEWNPEYIQEYCESLSKSSIEELTTHGYLIDNQSSIASHLFGVRLPKNISMQTIKDRLEQNKILISYRGDALRISPNVYNTQSELSKLIDLLKEIAGSSK